LAGKVAVVTGASSGIGYAIARALAAEGCSVVITGRNESSLAKSAARLGREVQDGALVVPIVCDVRDADSVRALFDSVGKRFARLDVLVNNAGIIRPPTAMEDTTAEMWHDIVQTNLTGVFLCTRAALSLMKSGATIINNLSAAAKQIFPKLSAYTAAKTGAYGFTLSLREELVPRGIRVTALVLGATATPIWQQIMADAPRENMIDVDSVAKAVVFAVLLPPKVNPSEIRLDPTGGAL
jgi:NAD(P)-dependent dehydrogenase (short-subunit alcohol dehydrogenase family)